MNNGARNPVEQRKKAIGEMPARAKLAGAIVILHATHAVFESGLAEGAGAGHRNGR